MQRRQSSGRCRSDCAVFIAKPPHQVYDSAHVAAANAAEQRRSRAALLPAAVDQLLLHRVQPVKVPLFSRASDRDSAARLCRLDAVVKQDEKILHCAFAVTLATSCKGTE